ncbi:MAG: 3-dehydroquinate synthase family protein [Acidimicrobiia bacterium]
MRRYVIQNAPAGSSAIVVGRDLIPSVAAAVAEGGSERAAILCQPATESLADRVATALLSRGVDSHGFTLPDGEAAKRVDVVEDMYRKLNAASLTRDDVIVAVGGGALTDAAGFIAGTFLRGVPAIYLPTTMLGAVDAAIGGKTGINVDGKNLAGLFVHPRHVFVDIDTLDGLPRTLRMEGAAEAVKAGFIDDMAIVEAYERSGIDGVDLEDVVNRAIGVKVDVVNEDFTEKGRRAILNYGHTVGHAVETAAGIPHGHAVSIGIAAAGAASAFVTGFAGEQRQRDLLMSLGLPVVAPAGTERGRVRALMARDKKRDATGLRMVLLEDFGSPVVVAVDDATVHAALGAVGLASGPSAGKGSE